MKKNHSFMLILLIAGIILFNLPGCGGSSSVDIGIGALTGTVLTNTWNGLPLEGVTVSNGFQTATTDAQGKFTLVDVPAGTTMLSLTKPEYATVEMPVDIIADSTVSQDFVMPLAPGAYILMESQATNLTPLPAADYYPEIVYLHRMATNDNELIAVDSNGNPLTATNPELPAPLPSMAINASMSADGRYVVFLKYDLVPLLGAVTQQLFVRDRHLGTTTLISKNTSGAPANGNSHLYPTYAISATGRYIVFTSEATDLADVRLKTTSKKLALMPRHAYLYDQQTGTITLLSKAPNGDMENGSTFGAAISTDERFVTFDSNSTNLLDTGNGVREIYVKELATGAITRISSNPDGSRRTKNSGLPSLSPDGTYVVYEAVSETQDEATQVYLYNRSTGVTKLVSYDETGAEGADNGIDSNSDSYFGSVTYDGRYVAFTSRAHNLTGLEPYIDDMGNPYNLDLMFVRDMQTGTLTKVVLPNQSDMSFFSGYGHITPDGAYVMLENYSIPAGGTTETAVQVYRFTQATGTYTPVSVNSSGVLGDSDSWLNLLNFSPRS